MGLTDIEMKVPSCVLWGLTRSHSAFKVQPNGSKSRRECFNSDPQNLTNLHNASAQGFTQRGLGLTAEKAPSKSGKQFRRVYHLRVGHKSYHNAHGSILKNKFGQAGLNSSNVAIRRDTARAAKVIGGLTAINEKRRALLYRRLGRLHRAFSVRGGAAAAKK